MKLRSLITCLVSIFILTLCLITGCSDSSISNADLSFSTPEETIQSFIDAVKANDYDSAMSICPIEEIAKGFDYTAYITNKRNSYILVVPSSNEFNTKANADMFKGNFAQGMAIFVNSLFPSSKTDFDKALEDLSTIDLSTLKNIIIKSIDIPSQANDKQSISLMNEQGAFYGADEMTERIVLIEINGQTYMEGFTLLKYGDSWGIQYLHSELAGTPVNGGALPVTQSEYESKVHG